jgi:hypothetical protein
MRMLRSCTHGSCRGWNVLCQTECRSMMVMALRAVQMTTLESWWTAYMGPRRVTGSQHCFTGFENLSVRFVIQPVAELKSISVSGRVEEPSAKACASAVRAQSEAIYRSILNNR